MSSSDVMAPFLPHHHNCCCPRPFRQILNELLRACLTEYFTSHFTPHLLPYHSHLRRHHLHYLPPLHHYSRPLFLR